MEAIRFSKVLGDTLSISFYTRYARKYFSNVEEAHVKEVQVAMALLAFRPGTSCKKYEVRCLCSGLHLILFLYAEIVCRKSMD